MRERTGIFSGAAQASLAALVLVACSGGDTAMAPRVTPDAVRGIVALTGNGAVGAEQFEVCKDFLGGEGPASFTLTGTSTILGVPTPVGPHNFNLNDGQCLVVYQTVENESANLTVTENTPSGTGWTTTVSGVRRVNFVDTPFGPTQTNTASGVAASGGNGVLVEFLNEFDPPEEGCTLTQGYWKTHSEHGPAPEDIRWFDLGDVDGDGTSEGADEAFFNSGKTWYQIFWIAPGQGKNQSPVLGKEYLQLAHQYMAARLNVEAGATPTSAVTTALNGATTFFTAGNLTAVPTSSWAGTLGSFNEGAIGPGHCGDE
jgi:hypothetical protein